MDGVKLGDSKADLIDGQLFSSLNITEDNQYVSSFGVLTGTDTAGQSTANTCSDWTDGTSSYRFTEGFVSLSAAQWTDYADRFCDSSGIGRLYCFEDQ